MANLWPSYNLKCLLQRTLTEQIFGFDPFKPKQLDFAGISQPFFTLIASEYIVLNI